MRLFASRVAPTSAPVLALCLVLAPVAWAAPLDEPLPERPVVREDMTIPPAWIRKAIPLDYPELARHPKGSIATRDLSTSALEDADLMKQRADGTLAAEEFACQKKFLSAGCARDARDLHRYSMAAINAVRNEAREFNRRDRERERVLSREEKRSRDVVEAPDKEADRRKNLDDFQTKLSKYQGKKDAALVDELDRAQKRAEYERKKQERADEEAKKWREFPDKERERQDKAKGQADKLVSTAEHNTSKAEKLNEKVKKRTDDAAIPRKSVADAAPKPLPQRPPPLTAEDKMLPMPQ